MFELDPVALLAGFAIGLIVLYTAMPAPRVVVKFPSPMNAGKVTYSEPGGCFTYDALDVPCPSDASAVKDQPRP